MDGLFILGAQGRPIVLSRFRNRRLAYPLMFVDHMNNALRACASGDGFSQDRALPPVLAMPLHQDIADVQSVSSEEASEGSASPEHLHSSADDNVWSTDAAAGPSAEAEPRALPGAVLCQIKVGELRFVMPITRNIDPLVPLCFLHKVVAVLQEYLIGSGDASCMTEELIANNFDIVYQLLEEMLDGDGNVLITEVNLLKDIVLPPSWLDRLVQTVGLGSQTEQGRTSLASPIPWRGRHAKYTKNEIFFDFIEHISGIVDRHGTPVVLDLQGQLECSAKLSGMPELTVHLNTPKIMHDSAWHPCIRVKKWNAAHILNFIPPDGTVELGTYRLDAALGKSARSSVPPLHVHVRLDRHRANPGMLPFEIAIESRVEPQLALHAVLVEWQLGDAALGVDASVHEHGTFASGGIEQGTVVFDRAQRLLRWNISRLGAHSSITLRGAVLTTGETCHPLYALQVHFRVPSHSLSGLRASTIHVEKEAYTPAKGVRNSVVGALEWRY